MPDIRLKSRGWSVQRTAGFAAGGRRSVAAKSSFPPQFLTAESSVAEEFSARPSAQGRRAGATPAGALDFSYDLAEGEAAVLAIQETLLFLEPVRPVWRDLLSERVCRDMIREPEWSRQRQLFERLLEKIEDDPLTS
jgi:hypothetical protein